MSLLGEWRTRDLILPFNDAFQKLNPWISPTQKWEPASLKQQVVGLQVETTFVFYSESD